LSEPPAWQLFDRYAEGYEAWYVTPRGRRADFAERGLLERLLTLGGVIGIGVELKP
jgi:hypothetical protein